ncbi:MAG: translation initiation factor [Muribaculaceae bacterium]
MDSGNPFDALKSLMGTLPDGPEDTPAEEENAPHSAAAQTVTLYYERKGRGGKEATIIVCHDSMSDAETANLGAALKKTIGTGGSVRGNEILLQGDRREALRKRLAAMGYRVKG